MEHKCSKLEHGITISQIDENPIVWAIYDEINYQEINNINYCPYCGEKL